MPTSLQRVAALLVLVVALAVLLLTVNSTWPRLLHREPTCQRGGKYVTGSTRLPPCPGTRPGLVGGL